MKQATTLLYVLAICLAMAFVVIDLKIPLVHVVLTIGLYLTFGMTFIQWFRKRKNISYPIVFKLYIIFFLVYSAVIFYQITRGRLFPLQDMLGCPKTVVSFLSETIILLFLLLFLPILQKQRNIALLFKAYIFINLISLICIRFTVGQNDLGGGALMYSCITSGIAALAIAFRKQLFTTVAYNKISLMAILASCVMIWGFCNKRGPILYFMCILLFWYFAQNRNHLSRIIINLLVFVLIVLVCQNLILDILKDIAPNLFERFNETISSGDTSGRFGDEDSGYTLAYMQILQNPWTGTYFRMTTPIGLWTGMYPHNFFLESMMTFGLAGTIPFLFFIIYGLKNSFGNLQNNRSLSKNQINIFFSILMLNSFLTMMSTGTPLLNRTFWISLGAVLCFTPINKIQTKS